MRGLTELTREGEVTVWGLKSSIVSVRPVKSSPKVFPPRTCHVHAFRDDLGGINYITKLDSMIEFDSVRDAASGWLCTAKPSGRARSPGLGDRAWST